MRFSLNFLEVNIGIKKVKRYLWELAVNESFHELANEGKQRYWAIYVGKNVWDRLNTNNFPA